MGKLTWVQFETWAVFEEIQYLHREIVYIQTLGHGYIQTQMLLVMTSMLLVPRPLFYDVRVSLIIL